MTKLFSLLRLLRTLERFKPHTQITIDWGDHDKKSLLAFLQSPTGVKLEAFMGAHIAQAALTACAKEHDHSYHCGVANGIRVGYATIESLKFRQPEAHTGNLAQDDSRIPSEFTAND